MLKATKIIILLVFLFVFIGNKPVLAKLPTPTPTLSPTPTIAPTVTPIPRVDLTETRKETINPLNKLLEDQKLGQIFPLNPLKYALRKAVAGGVPANTIVLLLLLPLIAAVIAAARHLVGIRGFGIFLPAALSVTFVATGPVLGVFLFILIVAVSTVARFVLRKLKLKLQYLPRMALILWAVVVANLALLFISPFLEIRDLANVSIFAVLILILLSEEITKVQLGKSLKVAVDLGVETLILAFISYIVLSLRSVQNFVLLNPEITLLGTLVFDFMLGKYTGLRLREYWRFRRLINGK